MVIVESTKQTKWFKNIIYNIQKTDRYTLIEQSISAIHCYNKKMIVHKNDTKINNHT